MYKIKWLALPTGATGQGKPILNELEAAVLAGDLNEKHKGLIVHWAEKAEGRNEEEKSV